MCKNHLANPGSLWYNYFGTVQYTQRAESPLQTSSAVHCNIAFGDMVLNAPVAYLELHIGELLPIMIDMLTDIPHTDFERRLSWTGQFLSLA